MKGYWIVDVITMSKEGKRWGYKVPYPFWFHGHYPDGKPFFWGQPFESLWDEQFDYSHAVMSI